jgi:dipeptidyl aminopeptidase/acylaminoacyl peptidase
LKQETDIFTLQNQFYMMLRLLTLVCLLSSSSLWAQNSLGKLTVDKIMRDPKWIGSSPSNTTWSADGKTLYFNWNPDKAPSDSLYAISNGNMVPRKVSVKERQEMLTAGSLQYNAKKTAYAHAKGGDIFYVDVKSGKTKKVVQTTDIESNPQFSFNETKLIYNRSQNLFAWDIVSGETMQLTRIQTGAAPTGGNRGAGREPREADNLQEKWLTNNQLQYFEVLKSRKDKRAATLAYNNSLPKEKELKILNIEDKFLQNLSLSADGRFVSYRLFKQSTSNKATIVPNYVTESGFTTDIPARTKVGEVLGTSEMYVYDREKDTLYKISTEALPGIKELPAYLKDYPAVWEEKNKKPANRAVNFGNTEWSPSGKYLLLDVRSQDNKDRWLAVWDAGSGTIKNIDRIRDEAWVGGPGFNRKGWVNEEQFWYHSENSGYSHLYVANAATAQKQQITSGKYEVQEAELSANKKYFYITSNEVHPGEKHFYRLPVTGGNAEKLTTLTGNNEVSISPDEKWMAILYSYSNKPTELYMQELGKEKTMVQVTNKAQSEEFKTYAWKDPEVISFKASDGADVYARVYKPANPDPKKPAVIFVHGAGYLQNAHKWWSSYFREYMFHNLLADEGYYVMDIDYRGSAGYGRDWRTGIYRHMGGKDLSDHVDAAAYLQKTYGVDKNRVGIYGGSYGGFISLMAMFNEPNSFAAGAALRPVTDWAQYNHGYTANILNEPFNDSIAYRKSSPLYFADGLKGHLLICHGMVDVNVHYQDAVKLTQRLIELGKDNWELASYPMEDHGFVEPSSWTDEYKRIYKLFETVLKKP